MIIKRAILNSAANAPTKDAARAILRKAGFHIEMIGPFLKTAWVKQQELKKHASKKPQPPPT